MTQGDRTGTYDHAAVEARWQARWLAEKAFAAKDDRTYAVELSFLDREFGRLVDWLRAEGHWDDTLCVVTADHGEALGQHGYYFEHGLQPYQECARVPLIVSRPGTLPEGAVVEAPVGLIDVPGTVLEDATTTFGMGALATEKAGGLCVADVDGGA